MPINPGAFFVVREDDQEIVAPAVKREETESYRQSIEVEMVAHTSLSAPLQRAKNFTDWA